MFNLVITVKRGSACSVPDGWAGYPTLELARTAAATAMRHETVQRVMIVRNTVPPTFVQWGPP